MSQAVESILSNYASETPGVIANLRRLLNSGALAGTGKLVILPVDQGFEHGPARSFAANPPAYDPLYHFGLAIESGCNAFAAPLGMLEEGAREYAGDIPLILKVNNSAVLSAEGDPTILSNQGRYRASCHTSQKGSAEHQGGAENFQVTVHTHEPRASVLYGRIHPLEDVTRFYLPLYGTQDQTQRVPPPPACLRTKPLPPIPVIARSSVDRRR